VRVHGPAGGDEGSFIRNPSDLDSIVVEVDEVDSNAPVNAQAEDKISKLFSGWGDYSFSKANKPSRPLFVGSFGDSMDYYDDTAKPNLKVRFLNRKERMDLCAGEVKASERSVRGSGNEGASGAFLYKRCAILIPLVESAEHSLPPFSIEHARRTHPNYLP